MKRIVLYTIILYSIYIVCYRIDHPDCADTIPNKKQLAQKSYIHHEEERPWKKDGKGTDEPSGYLNDPGKRTERELMNHLVI
jgi:hypothetical protein